MSTKNNPKLRLSVIISLVLHLALVAILGFSAFTYISPTAGDNGNAVEAIMVDSNIMSQQYQRQLQQKAAVEEVERQRQTQVQQRAREIQEQQKAEQQRLKDLERERLQALTKQKEETAAAKVAEEAKQKAEEAAAKAKAILEEQQKQSLLAKQKAEEAAKLRAQQELVEKQRIEQERLKAETEKQKAVEEAEKAKLEAERLKQHANELAKAEADKQKQREDAERLKAEAEKQAAAEEAKRQAALNDILGDLTSATPRAQQGASSAEIDKYKSLIHNAISNKFVNSRIYSGKNCVIKIVIARDGLLLDVSASEGDAVLCREAVSATKLAVIPKPTTDAIYQQVKNLTIDFRPR